jgi:hypothetical protein
MSSPHRRSAQVFIAAIAVGALTLAALAETGSPARKGGIPSSSDAVTIGALARILVSEVATNAPVGGFGEKFSMDVISAVGYQGRVGSSSPATVGDLQSMLSSLGIDAATSHPEEMLTSVRVSQTLNSVRTALPHFQVPEDFRRDGGDRGDPEKPGPCQVARQVCVHGCLNRSPSGTGGTRDGCIQECQAAFEKCLRGQRPPHHDGHR